jgi:iron complex transport system substrate-binding protein
MLRKERLLKLALKNRFAPLGLIAFLLFSLLLAACGDNTATPVAPTTAASVATTAPATSAPATTAAITTSPATTAAATSAAATSAPVTTAATSATTLAATTSAVTTAAATTSAMASAAPTTYPLTITDDAKNSVTFDKAPTRIVSLAPSNTELAYALGLGDKVVGVDDNSNYPADVSKVEKVGGFSGTNLEKIVSLSPDIVLAAGITSKDTLTSLQSRKLKVVIINPLNLAGIVTNLRLLGQIENVPEKAEAAVKTFQDKLDEVSAKIKTASAKPRVFYELDPTLYTVGPGSFIDEIITRAGGQNIVTDASNPYPQLNQEAVISKDPEVILVGDDTGGTDTPEIISARPGWNVISAVKNKRVFAVSADLVNRPGPRAALGVEEVAKLLYPDLFK